MIVQVMYLNIGLDIFVGRLNSPDMGYFTLLVVCRILNEFSYHVIGVGIFTMIRTRN